MMVATSVEERVQRAIRKLAVSERLLALEGLEDADLLPNEREAKVTAVAARVETTRRRVDVSWAHHQELTATELLGEALDDLVPIGDAPGEILNFVVEPSHGNRMDRRVMP